MLKNHTLGLNKISFPTTQGFNIFESFQVYCCKKKLLEVSRNASKGLKVLYYFREFQKLKNQDKKFCENLFHLFKVVLDPSSSLQSLKKILNKTGKCVIKLEEKYRDLINQYPDAEEVKEMYGSLLLNLLNNEEDGHFLLVSKQIKKKPN